MAAVPSDFAEAGRQSSSSNHEGSVSFGRGGAGNIHPAEESHEGPINLHTPTIKSDYYTTGRGGSGNMAKNTDPEEARRAQDLAASPRRESESKTRVGRGGVANVFTPSQDEIAAAKRDNARWESAIGDEPKGTLHKGLADKGKEWLFRRKGRNAYKYIPPHSRQDDP